MSRWKPQMAWVRINGVIVTGIGAICWAQLVQANTVDVAMSTASQSVIGVALASDQDTRSKTDPSIDQVVEQFQVKELIAQQIPELPPQDVIPPLPSSSPFHQVTPSPADVLPPLEQLLPPVSPLEPVSPPLILLPVRIERFEFEGNTAFNDEKLSEVTAAFLRGTGSTSADLLLAIAAIEQLYQENGYVTSGAFIRLDQDFQDGVVTIAVSEGQLSEIIVTGNQRLNSRYVRSRLASAAGAPLNQESLLDALQLLRGDPLIDSLQASLSQGIEIGSNILTVSITEADSFRTELSTSNDRSPSVGSFRQGISLTEANLLGLGDRLSLGYHNSDGSNSFEARYVLPLNPRNGTLALQVGNTNSQVIEPPFNFLDIESSFQSYDLTLRQPLSQTVISEFAIGLTASWRESKSAYQGGEPFLVRGADAQGETRISALRFFQEWVNRSERDVFAVRSQFNLGLDLLNSTVQSNAPDSRFLSWQGQAQWARLLADDTVLLLRSSVQLADGELLPNEQFSLGGQDTVRGYRQNLLLGDRGVFASAEARLPILRIPEWESVLQITPFVDTGVVWSQGQLRAGSNHLISVGVGLQWQMPNLAARLDWGIPLIDVENQRRTWQENGIHFSLIISPF